MSEPFFRTRNIIYSLFPEVLPDLLSYSIEHFVSTIKHCISGRCWKYVLINIGLLTECTTTEWFATMLFTLLVSAYINVHFCLKNYEEFYHYWLTNSLRIYTAIQCAQSNGICTIRSSWIAILRLWLLSICEKVARYFSTTSLIAFPFFKLIWNAFGMYARLSNLKLDWDIKEREEARIKIIFLISSYSAPIIFMLNLNNHCCICHSVSFSLTFIIHLIIPWICIPISRK